MVGEDAGLQTAMLCVAVQPCREGLRITSEPASAPASVRVASS